METLKGTITQTQQGGSSGRLRDDFSQLEVDFINPKIPNIAVGDVVDYIKLIQSTPNGDTVINILKAKRPS